MKRRKLHLLEVTNGNATHIKVELNYHIGGMNYFSCRNEVRGLYISVTPVNRTEHNGGLISESYTAFSGTKMLLKEMTRFSQKVLDTFEVNESDLNMLLNDVLKKNGITLKLKEGFKVKVAECYLIDEVNANVGQKIKEIND